MKKNISILGSTGSVGLNSLNIIKKKKNLFNVYLLSANKNYNLICKQIVEHKPNFFLINDAKVFLKVKSKFKKKKITILNKIDPKKKQSINHI